MITRFVDRSSDEIHKTILTSPIQGLRSVHLVDLHTACRPLYQIFGEKLVQQKVASALTKNCNPQDGLTKDGSASICLYTMSWPQFYQSVNRYLRTGDRTNLLPYRPYIKLVLTSLFDLPWAPRQALWRAVEADLRESLKCRTKVIFWPITSCTTKLNVVESYLGVSENHCTVLCIETRFAKDIGRHSIFRKEEGERLILPGTPFYVSGVDNSVPNRTTIHLKDFIPSELLIASSFPNASMPEKQQNAWSEEELLHFINVNRDSKNRIFLENYKMGEWNITILANEFANNIHWLELSLWRNCMGPRCARHINRILRQSKLTYLHLGRNRLGSRGMKYLSALENHETLTVLDLWENSIDDEGIEHLVRFLPRTKLVKINLGNNKITDRGCKLLFSHLPCTMKEIHLFSNQITTASIDFIAHALRSTCPKLKALDLRGNPIWQVSGKKLKAIARVNQCDLEPEAA